MITYATRDDILDTLIPGAYAIGTNNGVKYQLTESIDGHVYALAVSGNALGCIYRVDYVADSANGQYVRIAIVNGEDESRSDNAVTFGKGEQWAARTTPNALGRKAAGQCDCGDFYCGRNH